MNCNNIQINVKCIEDVKVQKIRHPNNPYVLLGRLVRVNQCLNKTLTFSPDHLSQTVSHKTVALRPPQSEEQLISG